MTSELTEAMENEWYVVRYSGEVPEIAYNSAIYYLTRAPDGPHLRLDEQQVSLLQQAAVDRYAEIVVRDLHHANSDKSLYRGVARSIINYQRFCVFCSRQQLEVDAVRKLAAEALLIFLETESKRLQSEKRTSIINCTFAELQKYAALLGVVLGDNHQALAYHCPLAPSSR
jgi:hypothetical protein